MHEVAILALHGVVVSDLATPCDLFGRVPGERYRVVVCGEGPEVRAACLTLRVPFGLERIARADTVVVAGVDDPVRPVPDAAVEAVRAAARNGARMASICSGAFVLAAAGLLDGRRATTHWRAAPLLAERHPAVKVDPDVLFVDEGDVLTSAGASAGLDLCLHIVERDHGRALAAEMARLAVAPLRREGGQAQYIRHGAPRVRTSLAPLLDWLAENLHRPVAVDEIARRAAASQRTLSRRFREQTGQSPQRWLLLARIRRAQELLEATPLDVGAVGAAVGFDAPASFRERFREIVGTSPTAYRRAFAAAQPSASTSAGSSAREASRR